MRAGPSGELEICNAGHGPVALAESGSVFMLDSSDLPLGMFSTAHFSSDRRRLDAGDTLLACTDGLSEAESPAGLEYAERLESFVEGNHGLPAGRLLRAWIDDVNVFRDGLPPTDDLTAMV